MKRLRLSDDLSLPLDAVTRRMAVLAMSGAGKSNVAVVLAEQMHGAGIPWVAIDPKGDWWGVRSSESGKGPGLPIPVLGGLHGDIPLEPTAGKVIAEMVAEQRMTCVLDVSEFDSNQDRFRFLADFGETLLRKNRQALHLFLEEADEYLPQKLSEKGNAPRCLGVWQKVVKRGRFRGIGSTQITQRSASLNKDTLYQAELLIAMRNTGPGDLKAVRGWVQHHNAADDLVASLPTLRDGEGWVSSPAWLRDTVRTRFNRRQTFDSGATPVLAGKVKPATLADVDLGALKERMAATIERAKADDPKALRDELARLRKELDAARAVKPAPAAVKVASVPVITDKQLARLEKLAAGAQEKALAFAQEARTEASRLAILAANLRDAGRQTAVPLKLTAAPTRPQKQAPVAPQRPQSEDGDALTGPMRKVLNAMAWLDAMNVPTPFDKVQVAVVAGYSPTSGGYANLLGKLKSGGFIFYPQQGTVCGTEYGDQFMERPDIQPTREAMHSEIKKLLPAPQWKVLEPLLHCYPEPMSKEALAEQAGYSATSGGYANLLGRLRTLGLVDYPAPGQVIAREILFP